MTRSTISATPAHSVILAASALYASPDLAAIRDVGFVHDATRLDDHVRAAIRMWLQDRIPADTPDNEIEARMGRYAMGVLGVYDAHRLSNEVAAGLLDFLLEMARPELLAAIAELIAWSRLGVDATARPGNKTPPAVAAAEAPTPPKPVLANGGVVASKPASSDVRPDIQARSPANLEASAFHIIPHLEGLTSSEARQVLDRSIEIISQTHRISYQQVLDKAHLVVRRPRRRVFLDEAIRDAAPRSLHQTPDPHLRAETPIVGGSQETMESPAQQQLERHQDWPVAP